MMRVVIYYNDAGRELCREVQTRSWWWPFWSTVCSKNT